MSDFNEDKAVGYLEVLKMTASKPPSSSVIDPGLVKRIQSFLDSPDEKSAVRVWNFYKECLDLAVRYSLTNGFMLRLFDLEAVMTAPEGAFSQAAGNMDKAPWRIESIRFEH